MTKVGKQLGSGRNKSSLNVSVVIHAKLTPVSQFYILSVG